MLSWPMSLTKILPPKPPSQMSVCMISLSSSTCTRHDIRYFETPITSLRGNVRLTMMRYLPLISDTKDQLSRLGTEPWCCSGKESSRRHLESMISRFHTGIGLTWATTAMCASTSWLEPPTWVTQMVAWTIARPFRIGKSSASSPVWRIISVISVNQRSQDHSWLASLRVCHLFLKRANSTMPWVCHNTICHLTIAAHLRKALGTSCLDQLENTDVWRKLDSFCYMLKLVYRVRSWLIVFIFMNQSIITLFWFSISPLGSRFLQRCVWFYTTRCKWSLIYLTPHVCRQNPRDVDSKVRTWALRGRAMIGNPIGGIDL